VWLKPRGLNSILNRNSPDQVTQYYDFVTASVAERIKVEESIQASTEKDRRKDIFHYLFQAKDPESGRPAYSPDELNSEADLLIVAGSDTTAISLCSFFFYIARNRLAYRKVTHEIRHTFGSVEEIRGDNKLFSCQYLRACIDEALRMTPVGPGEPMREVLQGGLEVDGVHLPEGCGVGTSGWSIHHNEEYYADAWTYRPERWIVDETTGVTTEDVTRAQAAFHPFLMGPGNCIGQKLAILELLITVARTLYRIDVRIPQGNFLGGGAPELGWGRRDKNVYQLQDAYVAIRNGPMVEFRKRDI
jgi:cytochrome P450